MKVTRIRPVAIGVIALSVVLGAACGAGLAGESGDRREAPLPGDGSVATAPQPREPTAETVEATEPRLRFGDVSVAVPPEDSGLTVHGDYLWPESPEMPEGGAVISVAPRSHGGNRDEYLEIDATTGEVLLDTIGPDHRSAADAVVASVRVESGPAAVWPVADVAPTGPRLEAGNISYIEPDASSGIFVVVGEGGIQVAVPGVPLPTSDCDEGNRTGAFLFVHNGRTSSMTIDGEAGEMGNVDKILPEDLEAFERFAASVVVEVPC